MLIETDEWKARPDKNTSITQRQRKKIALPEVSKANTGISTMQVDVDRSKGTKQDYLPEGLQAILDQCNAMDAPSLNNSTTINSPQVFPVSISGMPASNVQE